MKVVYHERYREVYSGDPASEPGRMESICDELRGQFDFVSPKPASEDDLRLVHDERHIDRVKKLERIYEIARFAVGGAIMAAEIAIEGEQAFGLIRPPGHHASRESSWGFCYFNNVAIAIERLRRMGRIEGALIVDFDLHYGDGTDNIFINVPEVSYFHVPHKESLRMLSEHLNARRGYDILVLSAGFDRHEDDWGGTLKTNDYRIIGGMTREWADRECEGRLFGVLEGGYNMRVLGRNVKAFLDGMKSG